jgi:hypothetical protein
LKADPLAFLTRTGSAACTANEDKAMAVTAATVRNKLFMATPSEGKGSKD